MRCDVVRAGRPKFGLNNAGRAQLDRKEREKQKKMWELRDYHDETTMGKRTFPKEPNNLERVIVEGIDGLLILLFVWVFQN